MRAVEVMAAAVLWGCSSNAVTHASAADESCSAPPCAIDVNVSGGPPAGSALVDGGSTTLTGTVGVYSDTGFTKVAPYTGSGSVGVFGPAGPPNLAAGTFTGATYSLTGAPVESLLWADLQSTSSAAVLPTLSAINDTGTGTSVAFVQTSVLSLIFAQLSHAPQSISPTRGQLVLAFVNTAGAPLSGVTITLVPQGADIAYDSGTGYSDVPQVAGTGARGMALVLNATAAVWPGALAPLTFAYGTPKVTASFNAYVAQGAVTVVTIAVTA